MKLTEQELSYRRSAIEGASPMGLMIALLDTLAGDLRRAAAALRRNDIETRCKELNHAALVLGQLESWLDPSSEGDSAQKLAGFYGYLRSKMLEAAVKKSAAVLDAQVEMILHVRSAWQKYDTAPPPAPDKPAEVLAEAVATTSPAIPEATRQRFSHSA